MATEQTNGDPTQTAAILCDMWDKHWCKAATSRVIELAPRMNQLIKELRRLGVLIIHAPSDTLDFYKEHPGRKLAQEALLPETMDLPLYNWKYIDQVKEGNLPIDDSDGGCYCSVKCAEGSPWTRQIETLDIIPGDAITDNAEAIYLMKQRGIRNVIIMGVATNMCVLGRTFGIRNLVEQGFNVTLVRDMTDTMYNPAMFPYVDHFAGTDLVVEHIEKHWCPTITSDQFIGGTPFRFAEDIRK